MPTSYLATRRPISRRVCHFVEIAVPSQGSPLHFSQELVEAVQSWPAESPAHDRLRALRALAPMGEGPSGI